MQSNQSRQLQPSDDKAKTEETMERLQRNANVDLFNQLSKRMDQFLYDESSGLTFERWLGRYRLLFENEAKDLSETQKVELLVSKFKQRDYNLFADSIAPKTVSTMSFTDAVDKLRKLFGKQESQFGQRVKCLRTEMETSEDFNAYSARVNRMCEEFDFAKCTPDDFKVLIFTQGLKHKPTIEKILSKLYAIERQREEAANPETVPRLKLQDAVNIANTLSMIKAEASMVQSPTSAVAEVYSIVNWRQPSSVQTRTSPSTSKVPWNPCYFCGSMHFYSECQFKHKKCTECNEFGHKAGYCESAKRFHETKLATRSRRSQRKSYRAIASPSTSDRKPEISKTERHRAIQEIDDVNAKLDSMKRHIDGLTVQLSEVKLEKSDRDAATSVKLDEMIERLASMNTAKSSTTESAKLAPAKISDDSKTTRFVSQPNANPHRERSKKPKFRSNTFDDHDFDTWFEHIDVLWPEEAIRTELEQTQHDDEYDRLDPQEVENEESDEDDYEDAVSDVNATKCLASTLKIRGYNSVSPALKRFVAIIKCLASTLNIRGQQVSSQHFKDSRLQARDAIGRTSITSTPPISRISVSS